MDAESCKICGRTSKEANLLNAVLDREEEFVKLCETCAIVERAVIIQKPTKKQLEEAEVPYTVYERLARMARVKPKQNIMAREKAKQMASQIANRQSVRLNSLSQAPNQEPLEGKKQGIKILESNGMKEAVIDFSSHDIKIRDLQKLKKEMLEKQ